jgi:hypothetical protein
LRLLALLLFLKLLQLAVVVVVHRDHLDLLHHDRQQLEALHRDQHQWVVEELQLHDRQQQEALHDQHQQEDPDLEVNRDQVVAAAATVQVQATNTDSKHELHTHPVLCSSSPTANAYLFMIELRQRIKNHKLNKSSVNREIAPRHDNPFVCDIH